MAVPGFFAQEVVHPQVQCVTIGAGMPVPLAQLTISLWTCNSTKTLVQALAPGGFYPGLWIDFATSSGSTGASQTATTETSARNSGGLIIGGSGTNYELQADVSYYDQITGDGLTEYYATGLAHFLYSIDFLAQTVVAYANDQPLAHTVGSWGLAVAVDVSAGPWQLAQQNFTGLEGVADLWMAPTFVDLTNTASRRQFINADLSAVALPSNGHVTIAGSTVAPTVYLHALSSGSPSDFAVNNGSGPGWSVTSGTLAFQPEPGTCVLSRVHTGPPPPKLAIDDVNCTTIPELAINEVYLDWSDDRGHSFGNPIGHPMGDAGEYLTSIQYQRLGYGRDRVFRIFWSVPTNTALQGCFVEATPADS